MVARVDLGLVSIAPATTSTGDIRGGSDHGSVDHTDVDNHVLAWGCTDGRIVVYGAVTDDTVGDFKQLLDRIATSGSQAPVDLTGLTYVNMAGIGAIVDWCRRHHFRSRVTATAEIERVLGFCFLD